MLCFKDYSLEEIGLLLNIILEIEGHFRQYHKSQFFDEYFTQQNSDNSKTVTSLSSEEIFANEEMFENYLKKFKDLSINFEKKHNLSNIKEIVYFYNGNLTELFTKFEFLGKDLNKSSFNSMKYRFFLENNCFTYALKPQNCPYGSFPKELEHKKIKDLLAFNKQTDIFVHKESIN